MKTLLLEKTVDQYPRRQPSTTTKPAGNQEEFSPDPCPDMGHLTPVMGIPTFYEL